MKNIVIIEDETIAASHLERTLHEVLPKARVAAVLQSIEESVDYLQSEPSPDLLFVDIHLADGPAFRIFDQVAPACPVVFTTAYDQYALEAFRAGGVDYLLKPISRDDLQHTIEHLQALGLGGQQKRIEEVAHRMRHYRSHFLIPMRDKLIPVDVDQIACLFIEDKITRMLLLDGTRHTLDRPLDAVMEMLDPDRFFRANRQYIVAHRAICEISMWPISKLALTLSVETPDRIIISKARVPEFKQWYTK